MELPQEAENRPEPRQGAQQGPAQRIEKRNEQRTGGVPSGGTPLLRAQSIENRTEQRTAQSAIRAAEWLSPFELAAEQSLTEVPGAWASNKGCLEMTFAEYLQLLDWTGRQIRRDKPGEIPAKLAPILERLSVTTDGWLKLVTEFSRVFRRSAGTPISLGREAAKWGRKRREGISHSRAVFAAPRT